jgi:hypothetical protein
VRRPTKGDTGPPGPLDLDELWRLLGAQVMEDLSRAVDTHPGSLGPAISAPDATFTTGEIVAERYRIVGFLGRGGMGEVYRAEDLTLGQCSRVESLGIR